MVNGSIYGNAFIAVSVALAIWSLWWIVRGSLTNGDERNAEDEARRRVAEGGQWDDGRPSPRPFSDEELAELSDALAPSSLEEAGVEARPRARERRRAPWSNRRP
ncbi:MAG: hypothetical protein PGN13_02640 [Patulibacter minatonensis]